MPRPDLRPVIVLLILSLAYWLVNFSIVTLGVLMDSGEWRFFWQRFGAYSLSAIPAWISGVILYRMFSGSRPGRWTIFGIAFVVTATIHGALYGLMYKYILPLEYFAEMNVWKLALSVALVNFTLTGVWQLLIVSWVLARKAVENERRAAQAETLAQSAQLEMLRYQLNPHFLFNTLNSISSLVVDKRNEDAEDMIMKLSGFLRRSLDTNPTALVPVKTEIEAIERYLSIEQKRFSDKLTTDVTIDPQTEDLLLPPMIIQPLIENAIKHAVAPSPGPVKMSIHAHLSDDGLIIEVRDTGPGLSAPHSEGVGLGNIRRRLTLLFEDDATLSLTSGSAAGTLARLTVPKIEAA